MTIKHVRAKGRIVLGGDDDQLVAIAATNEVANEIAARLNTHQTLTDMVREMNEWVGDASAYVRKGEPQEDFSLLTKRFTEIRHRLKATILTLAKAEAPSEGD